MGILNEDAIKQFRLVVRNYSKGTGLPISECAELIAPAFLKVAGKELLESVSNPEPTTLSEFAERYTKREMIEILNTGFNMPPKRKEKKKRKKKDK